jgi:hypothetical protein
MTAACLAGNLKSIRYTCALTSVLVKCSIKKSYFHLFISSKFCKTPNHQLVSFSFNSNFLSVQILKLVGHEHEPKLLFDELLLQIYNRFTASLQETINIWVQYRLKQLCSRLNLHGKIFTNFQQIPNSCLKILSASLQQMFARMSVRDSRKSHC